MKKLVTVLVVIGVLLLLFLLMGPLYILQEGEQAVVVQFGKIVRTELQAGLKSRVPFVDTIVKYPRKMLSWDGEPQRIPTAENQFIWVDATARWRITDIERFYASMGTITNAHSRLDDVLDSAARKVIARNPLREAVRNTNVIREIERTNVYATEGEGEKRTSTRRSTCSRPRCSRPSARDGPRCRSTCSTRSRTSCPSTASRSSTSSCARSSTPTSSPRASTGA